MASAEKQESAHAARAAAYWDVEDVARFFEEHGFPTAGVGLGQIDGATLLSLWDDPESADVFTAAVPDGLGFEDDVFKRFKEVMAPVQAAEDARVVRAATAACVTGVRAWREHRDQDKFRAAQELRTEYKTRMLNRFKGQGLTPGPAEENENLKKNNAEAHLELMRACLARL